MTAPMHIGYGLNEGGQIGNGLNPPRFGVAGVEPAKCYADGAGVVMHEAQQAGVTTVAADPAGVVQNDAQQAGVTNTLADAAGIVQTHAQQGEA